MARLESAWAAVEEIAKIYLTMHRRLWFGKQPIVTFSEEYNSPPIVDKAAKVGGLVAVMRTSLKESRSLERDDYWHKLR